MTCCNWRANKPQLSVPQLPFSRSAFLSSVSWTIMTPTGLNRYELAALLRQNAQWGSKPSTRTHTNIDVMKKCHKWSQTCRLVESKTVFLMLWDFLYLFRFTSESNLFSSHSNPTVSSLSLSRPWHPWQGISRWMCWQSSVSDSPTARPLA